MRHPRIRHGRRFSRGSALITVTIVLFVLSVICASMLVNVTFERRMNRRAVAVAQAKLNTDILLNYAASQITNNANLAYSDPPGLKTVPADFFPTDSVSGSSDAMALSLPDKQEVIACPMVALTNTASDGPKFYINPAAPINMSDKLKGQYVFREIDLIAAKSAVSNPQNALGTPIYNYGLLVLERRKVSLFNYLAFFDVARFRVTNPGSNIILDGPIQANKGIYFESGNHTSYVYMDSSVHTPGDLVFSGTTSAGKFMVSDGTFKSDGVTPNRIDLLKPNTSVLRQSSDEAASAGPDGKFGTKDDVAANTSFRDFMSNSTKGMLRTSVSGETTVVLDGLNYVDDGSSNVSDTYKISTNRRIDPTNPTLRNSTDAAYSEARAAETAKTAYQASLYVYVEQSGRATVFVNQNIDTYSSQTSQATSDAWKSVESYKAASDKAAWRAANPGAILSDAETASFITLPTTQRYYDAYTTLGTGAAKITAPSDKTKYGDLARGAIYDSQQRATVSMVDLNLGNLNTKIASGSLAKGSGSWSTATSKGWNGVLYVDVQSPGSRMQAPVVDAKTGNYIDATTGTFASTNLAGVPVSTGTVPLSTTLRATQPSLNITGTAVDFDTGAAVSDTTGLTGVRIQNATTVPGSKVGDPGFTMATNTATYTVGSFNADGLTSTGTTSLQDDQKVATDATKKIPAAVFSDKNVALSGDFANSAYDLDLYVPKPSTSVKTAKNIPQYMYDNWPFTGPSYSDTGYRLDKSGSRNGQYQYQRDPGNRGASGDPGLGAGNRVMELSSAFVVGDDESTNKGMHTVLSFLQPFSTTNDSIIMRGSMIGIYKARYFNKAAGSFYDYYVAPSRNYGFSSLFKAGKMPPAAPTISNYRRMRQISISDSDYTALKNAYTKPNTADYLKPWMDVVNKY